MTYLSGDEKKPPEGEFRAYMRVSDIVRRQRERKIVKMGDLVGAVISLAFAIVLSVLGLMGLICNIGFKLIKSLNELNKTLKEKSQSEDCDKSED